MPSLYGFSETEMMAFFMVLLRMTSFAVTWPVMGSEVVPAQAKVLLGLILSLLVFPTVDWKSVQGDLGSLQVMWFGLREVFIGVSLGFLARLFFFVMSICGEVISVSMGLSSGSLFNPVVGGSSTALEQFQVLAATMVFLALNAHHVLLSGLVESFALVPLSGKALSLAGYGQVGAVAQSLVIMGLKLSAPVMVTILCMNVTMGIIGRAVPQINVLITSLPVNIMLGLSVLIVALPLMLFNMKSVLESTTETFFVILRSY